jgi:hypothetical protein
LVARVETVCDHVAAEPDDEESRALQAIGDAMRGRPVEERGARIYDDEAGLIYEATIGRGNGRVWLNSLTILATEPGRQIDRDLLRRVPAQRIAEQVAMQLAADDAEQPRYTDDGQEVLRIRGAMPARRARGDRPADAELVADVIAHGMGRRQIAEKYRASLSTVDNWLTPLRRRGDIPRAKAGRPATRPENGR